MPLFDLPLEQLRSYTSSAVPPADFDAFWERTIAEARALPLNAVFEPVDNYLSVIDTYDVTYSGFGGNRIKGWPHIPSHVVRVRAPTVHLPPPTSKVQPL